MAANCPWCKAPREDGPRCPACGAIYAKAEAIRTHGRAQGAALAAEARVEAPVIQILPVETLDEVPPWLQKVEDPDLEWKMCIAAIPAALLLAMLLHASGMGRMVQHMFFTMPVHELGHAMFAWFCGFAAIPTLWKTIVFESRGFIAPIVLLGAIGYMAYRAHLANRPVLVGLAAMLVVLQAVGTFGIKERTAQMLFVFGGDGGAMIISTALMATFFFGKETPLYHGWLRWGFLVIGASAFVDTSATWWAARNDMGAIPFGENEGSGETDPLKLYDWYGWSIKAMVGRYLALAGTCLVALAGVYAWGVYRAKRARDAAPPK